jgi:hypothetical protein
MMTIDEIRRANLTALIQRFDGVGKLSEVIGKSETQVSQWRNASIDSRTKKPRGMSDEVCRHIEEMCKLPHGWMDNDHVGGPGKAHVSPDKLMEMISIYAQLDEPTRDQTLDFMRSAAEAQGLVTNTTAQNNS